MSSDRELERELRALESHVEYPPTPDLARVVRRRLDQEETGRPARSRTIWSSIPQFRWAVAAAALALVVAAPVLSPTMRDTITGTFEAGEAANGGQAAGGAPPIESKGDVAESGSTVQGESMPSSGGEGRYLGEGLGFGERVTLREARSGTDAPVLLPRAAGLGEPDQVYAGEPREEGVTLVYRARPGLPPLGNTEVGLVLTERVGGVEMAYFAEEARPESGFERVEVDGKRGYWAPAGRDASSRTGLLGGNILLWEQGDRAFRLEADLYEEGAIRIAESVR
ncbi:MAG: hypothetical protein LC714_01370 [Actinobacteria bacterium]|nr:hypothetical protein [Actinomycetota bacterium]